MSENEEPTPQKERERAEKEARLKPPPFWWTWWAWFGESIRSPRNFPHYLTAIFTFALAVFAWKAWQEAQRGTIALQDQVLAIKADQRPLMWGVVKIPPTYLDDSGQVAWDWDYQNIGRSIAYNVVIREYIKVGNENFQIGRNKGSNAIEVPAAKPIDVPPQLQGGFATVLSRAGINKDFFKKLLGEDSGVGILMEFEYSDASGKTKYTNAECMERLATGALAIIPPADCPK